MAKWNAWIYAGGRTVGVASEGVPDGPSLFAEKLKGWWSTPQAKVSMTELSQGDGSHAIAETDVLYSSRTVTLDVLARGRRRSEVQEAMESLLWMAHRIVTIRVADAASDTYATGYLEVASDSGKALERREELSLTIVCPDPRRYGAALKTAYMRPAAQADGGLVYSDSGVLEYPLGFSGETESGGCTATLHNAGTSTAYPIITTVGAMSDFAIRDVAGIGELRYGGTAWPQAPITIDCLRRVAACNGVDVTRQLTARTFPAIPAGGSITVTCSATADSSAGIRAEWRDTYI